MRRALTNSGSDTRYVDGVAIPPGDTRLVDDPDPQQDARAQLRAALVELGFTLHLPITTKTADYEATVNDRVILVDATDDDVTITLPPASASGAAFSQLIRVKRIDSSENAVTIQKQGSDTLNGEEEDPTTLLALSAKDFQSDGVSAWWIF